MKKIILALLLFFILYVPGYTQEPPIFLPLIIKGFEMPTINERWKVISPVGTTNYVLNPSAETTGNFTTLGAATVTRISTYQKYGIYAYRIQTGTNGGGISLTLSTLPNEACFATARIRGRIPANFRFIIGTGLKTPQLIEKIDTQWSLYGVMFAASECSGRTELRMIQQGNGIGDFYVDGVQVENLEYWTSYCDGDQPGCYWEGPPHTVISKRSALSREGGQVKDLYQDFGFLVEKVIGTGSANRDLGIDEYALLPGGELNNIKIQSREWSLIGKFIADSDDELYQNRQDLIKLLRRNPQKQPTKFLFYHPKGVREIKSFYSGGLEGDQSVFYDSWITEDDDKWLELNKYIEKAAIQLRSPDPYFYGQGEKATALDANDTATFRLIAARLKSTGQWDNLGPPNAAGTYTAIYAINEDSTYIYVGGDFQNFDNIAAADYIVRYNKQTETWSALGSALNGIVLAITIAPNGDVYIGGQFTNAGGIAAADYIVKWDGSAYSAVGVPISGAAAVTDVQALVFDKSGILYIGFTGTNWANIAAADNIVKWDGSAYSAVGSGLSNTVSSLAVGLDNTIYIGGAFLNAGGTGANFIVSWSGSAYVALSGGNPDGTLEGVVVDPNNGIVYLGGAFTSIGSVSANMVAGYNGTSYFALGEGLGPPGTFLETLAIAPDGILIVGGPFNTAGDITLADRAAKWNGYAWAHFDIDLPGTATTYTVWASNFTDPVIPQKYDIALGFNTTGTGNFAGKTTVTNEGSVDVFPKFVFKRTGGTTITLETIKNETTGKELLFDYDLLDGEQLTIDLSPTQKSIVSSYFGDRLDAILTNSDFGSFVLEIGSNDITNFCADQFALYPSSLEAFMIWKEVYESYD